MTGQGNLEGSTPLDSRSVTKMSGNDDQSTSLEQRREEAREVPPDLSVKRLRSPRLGVEPLAVPEVAFLYLGDLRADAAIVREQHDLGVERERAQVHVRRADPCDVVVDWGVLR